MKRYKPGRGVNTKNENCTASALLLMEHLWFGSGLDCREVRCGMKAKDGEDDEEEEEEGGRRRRGGGPLKGLEEISEEEWILVCIPVMTAMCGASPDDC